MNSTVTIEAVKKEILSIQYHHFEYTTLVVCAITLKNGYTVTGESACANTEVFNEELGRNLAQCKAEQKIWALLAFRLRDSIAYDELVDAEMASLMESTIPVRKPGTVRYIVKYDFGD